MRVATLASRYVFYGLPRRENAKAAFTRPCAAARRMRDESDITSALICRFRDIDYLNFTIHTGKYRHLSMSFICLDYTAFRAWYSGDLFLEVVTRAFSMRKQAWWLTAFTPTIATGHSLPLLSPHCRAIVAKASSLTGFSTVLRSCRHASSLFYSAALSRKFVYCQNDITHDDIGDFVASLPMDITIFSFLWILTALMPFIFDISVAPAFSRQWLRKLAMMIRHQFFQQNY